jgi:hypothetical protein
VSKSALFGLICMFHFTFPCAYMCTLGRPRESLSTASARTLNDTPGACFLLARETIAGKPGLVIRRRRIFTGTRNSKALRLHWRSSGFSAHSLCRGL